MNFDTLLTALLTALIFSVFGMAILGLGFFLIELITPKTNIREELVEKKNVALAIVLGATMLGIAIIISAAVHG